MRLGVLWEGSSYEKECPDGVVEEDGCSEDEHCEADYAIELFGMREVSMIVAIPYFFRGGRRRTALLMAMAFDVRSCSLHVRKVRVWACVCCCCSFLAG